MSQFTRSLMSLSLILFLGVAFLLQGLHGASGQEKSDKLEPSVVSAEQRAQTRITFKDKCSRCHGPDGKGNTVLGDMLFPPDFTDGKWWKELTDEQLMQSIDNGKNEMPAFGKKLTKSEILALIAYVRCFDESAASDKRKVKCD
jgi:cytochrome c6